jgi:hypothetical protein
MLQNLPPVAVWFRFTDLSPIKTRVTRRHSTSRRHLYEDASIIPPSLYQQDTIGRVLRQPVG